MVLKWNNNYGGQVHCNWLLHPCCVQIVALLETLSPVKQGILVWRCTYNTNHSVEYLTANPFNGYTNCMKSMICRHQQMLCISPPLLLFSMILFKLLSRSGCVFSITSLLHWFTTDHIWNGPHFSHCFPNLDVNIIKIASWTKTNTDLISLEMQSEQSENVSL